MRRGRHRAMVRAMTAWNLTASLVALAAPAPSGMHNYAELLGISLAHLRDGSWDPRPSRTGHDVAQRRADESAATAWPPCRCRTISRGATPCVDRCALARIISTALALHVRKVKVGAAPAARRPCRLRHHMKALRSRPGCPSTTRTSWSG
jgi:hypothetical protein